ncbi:uncharacterized protein LOC143020617 [Oratosquilla oratoria]|uniref:uncharacterized protein LOC143020617 n=1 Tax=Oratosquilla oratoria TaxID=337810 RepID=UPI003F76F63E
MKLFRNRGRRGGSKITRTVPVITNKRSATKKRKVEPRQRILNEVPRVWYSLPSIILSNVTSLANKMEEVIELVRSTGCDVMAITEAWQIIPEVCNIENFVLFHHLRVNRRGGGVALYCRADLNPLHLRVDIPEGVEALWVKLTPRFHPRHTASIIMCVIYHPPRANTALLLNDHIIETADSLRLRFPAAKLVVCGDFNRLDTSDILNHLNLKQVVTFPTHDQTTLDLIMTDMAQLYSTPRPLPPIGKSTHLTIQWSPAPSAAIHRIKVTRQHRPMPDSAMREFGRWIVEHPWPEVLNVEDVETKWTNYSTTTIEAFHHFFPVKDFSVHHSDAPWMTPHIKRLIKQRNKAFYTDRAQFRFLRNKVIREIITAKSSYYPNKLQHLKQQRNNTQWFSKIRALCGLQGNKTSHLPCISNLSPDLAAQEINSHFASICQTLPPLDPSRLPAYLPSPSPPIQVQVSDVATKLGKLKQNRSTTPSDLPIKIYKEFAPELALPLSSIINASLSQNTCPSDWKISYVTPIPKTLSPQSLSDLRPIAITPIPSLICEDLVFNSVYSNIKHSIDAQQFGNMKSSSTTHCLIDLLNFLHSNLDKRNTSLAVTFVDFRKAFDLVDHNVVLSKAIQLGIQPHLIAWLADFLTGRRQAVRYQGSTSPLLPLTCGVPQGTKMGPLCFLILINDALMDTPHRWKYVDDSTIGIPINTRRPDYAPLQNTLNKLMMWTENNNVTINTNKTVVMHFCTSTQAVPPPQLSLGPHPLQLVQSTKILGITLDAQLNWNQHITNIVRTASYKLYMLSRLKSLGTPTSELQEVYKTFILPTLMYASPAWCSSLTLTQRQKLERVQKRACRIILGVEYSSYDHALTTLTLSRVSQRHGEALRKFGESLLSHPRHRHLLPPDAPPTRHATRHINRLIPIKAPRTDRYKNSAIPSIVHIINSL